MRIAAAADVLIVVGTSLAVYPAASLVHYVRPGVPIYLVDPGAPDVRTIRNPLTHLRERAAVGMPELAERLRRGVAAGIKREERGFRNPRSSLFGAFP